MELLLQLVLAVIGIVIFAGLPALGLMLICRPLDHQYEWEKKLQGENPKPNKNQEKSNE